MPAREQLSCKSLLALTGIYISIFYSFTSFPPSLFKFIYSNFQSDIASSMNAIRTKASGVKSAATEVSLPSFEGDAGRARVNSGKKELGEESVRIRDASFTWNKEDADRVALENISFAAHKGELSCLVGRVGAGKSSLLGALLGDLHKLKGDVVVRGACAYVAQSPWVMNASVRENIVFGHRWDPGFYEKTVKACALSDDFATLPDGDATEVGERGISLSGGQKARVTLARAVYARADVVSCLHSLSCHEMVFRERICR